MKESIKLALILFISGLASVLIGSYIRIIYDNNNKKLPISLPEEISQASPGDILEVYKVSDSIYVQFKHIRENSDSPVILWNDDPESIPVDGTKVELQFTENDTIYIGNLE